MSSSASPYEETPSRGVSHVRRARTARARIGIAALLSGPLSWAACGGPPPPVPGPAPAQALSACPPPLLRAAGRVQPSRVRVENRTSDTLVVWLDRCRRHSRLARVAPGASANVRLPDRLVAFPEGLRFHAYTESPARHAGVFVLPVSEVPILELALSDATRADEADLARLRSGEDARDVGGFLVGTGSEGGGYAAVFSGDGAVLTWACDGRGRRHLTLGTDRTWRADEMAVRVRADGGAWQEPRRWRVVVGLSPSAIAPEADVERVTRLALASRELSLVLDPVGEGGREAHAFDVTGLERALREQRCFASLLGGA